MAVLWIICAVLLLSLLGCGILLLLNLRCQPVPDLSKQENVQGTRWEPYADVLQKEISKNRSLPWEDVWLTNHSGMKLHGRILRGNGEKTVMMAHGYRSSGENDFCGIVDYYWSRGFSVVMIDQRGHGQSEGRQLSFGVRERWDMVCWICWTAENLPGELWLHGVSMGAVSLLMALPLCGDVPISGVIADSVYDNVRELILYQAGRKYKLPNFPVSQIVSLEGSLLLGKDFAALYASDCAAQSGVPVYLICGTKDHTVPPGMSARFDRAENAQGIFIPDARHAMCWLASANTYEKALEDFIFRKETVERIKKRKGVFL